jgi:endonuclease/exonuclease/phosphatase family metal-dependent hydrolase
MSRLHERRPLVIAALVVAAGVAACDVTQHDPIAPDFAVVDGGGWGTQAFDVYVQNIYLGGETAPLFSLDFSNLPAVLAAANVFWGQVQQSAVPERAAEIVSEIADRRPHVVGLQEVLRFVLLDGAFAPIGGIDLLGAIEAEIAARGLPYRTEVVQATTSSALPLAFDPSVGVTRWLSFTDRVVVLRRNDVEVTSTGQGVYAAVMNLGPLQLKRGWARVSVEHAGTPHHFVTTHLETQALAAIQAAQADELLNQVLAGLDGVTIIGGDLNSDAAAGPGDPSWTPTYDRMVAAGFSDLWDLAPRSSRAPGYTCCQSADLRNDAPELDERIDFVLVRRADEPITEAAPGRGFFRFDLVGVDESSRTASGLWPSDHAGIVGGVRMLPE